jgi:hypothetical protein
MAHRRFKLFGWNQHSIPDMTQCHQSPAPDVDEFHCLVGPMKEFVNFFG